MLELVNLHTGRPTWIDPDQVAAITDAVEFVEPAIQGAPPTMRVVGTLLVVSGSQIHIRGNPVEVERKIRAARLPRRPVLNS